jgi:hypothetical protein
MVSFNRRYFQDEDAAKTYLIEQEVFPPQRICEQCHNVMILKPNRNAYRCSNRLCNKEKSMRANTFFWQARIPLDKLLLLACLWLNKTGRDTAATMSEISNRTVTEYFAHLKQLVADDVEENQAIIGGPGIIVEADESKFGRRKYNRGRRVEGCWVFGGVERTEERKCFAVPVPLILAHIHPGSTIISDMWGAYNFIPNNYERLTVNHSLNFVDPTTGAHTNTIEGTWNAMKRDIPVRNRRHEGMEEELWTFMWRRAHKNRSQNDVNIKRCKRLVGLGRFGDAVKALE